MLFCVIVVNLCEVFFTSFYKDMQKIQQKVVNNCEDQGKYAEEMYVW